MSTTDHALILFAHGARDPQWAEPFMRIRDQIAHKLPDALVTLAFLEIMKPSLEKAIDDFAAKGIVRITLVPLFMAQGGHLKEDLPKLIAGIQLRHPALLFNITPAIGEVDNILYMIAEWAAGAFVENDAR
ncbi:MAG: CbiX/SirB N-terminal domain-containing protein [Pseudomonadota bacterium]